MQFTKQIAYKTVVTVKQTGMLDLWLNETRAVLQNTMQQNNCHIIFIALLKITVVTDEYSVNCTAI